MAGWDGNGNVTLTYDWSDDRDAGININADRMDTQFEDVRGAIENTITKDGQNSATELNVDNLKLDGNTLSSTSGDITLDPTSKILNFDGAGVFTNSTGITVNGNTITQFFVHEQSAPNMTVRCSAGTILSTANAIVSVAAQDSPTITAPSSGNQRYDRITIDEDTGSLFIVSGTASASPTLPTIPTNKIPVAYMLISDSTTSITNSIITDERPVVNPLSVSRLSIKRAWVYRSATQSIPNNTGTSIAWNAEREDNDGVHDLVTNTSRLTVPADVAYADVSALISWDISTTGVREVYIQLNGTTELARCVLQSLDSNGSPFPCYVRTPRVPVSSGDYFEIIVVQNSGSALNVLADTGSVRRTWAEFAGYSA